MSEECHINNRSQSNKHLTRFGRLGGVHVCGRISNWSALPVSLNSNILQQIDAINAYEFSL